MLPDRVSNPGCLTYESVYIYIHILHTVEIFFGCFDYSNVDTSYHPGLSVCRLDASSRYFKHGFSRMFYTHR